MFSPRQQAPNPKGGMGGRLLKGTRADVIRIHPHDLAQTMVHLRVVRNGERTCNFGAHVPQIEICSGGSEGRQQQPTSLHVRNQRDPLKQHIVVFGLNLKEPCCEFIPSQRHSEHLHALLRNWDVLVSPPHNGVWVVHLCLLGQPLHFCSRSWFSHCGCQCWRASEAPDRRSRTQLPPALGDTPNRCHPRMRRSFQSEQPV